MIISLTGFMGCGKSSVGRYLSELLCCPFMDLDTVIEETQGRSIPDIFATDGEAAFRQMEVEALSQIIEAQLLRDKVVVALGGGAVMTPECAELVREKTHCIYLHTSVDTLVSHLENEAAGRPMLQGASLRARIEELMALRSATYEATAHDVIDTDGKTIEEIAAEINSRGYRLVREDL